MAPAPPAAGAQVSPLVAVLRERGEGERRVALVPRSVDTLIRAGLAVRVEAGAGAAAGYDDAAYIAAGARVTPGLAATLDGAALLLCVACPAVEVIEALPRDAAVAGLLRPAANAALLRRLGSRGVDALSLELLPRITRAQEMDVLSSMSTIAGYHGVLIAAERLPRFMPLLMTAAGTVRPARVLVIGAGVAGLQAIATARRLGAVVEAFDVREAAREQVESLGARFIETGDAAEQVGTGYAAALDDAAQAREHRVLADHVAEADAVVTTALLAGGTAPLLITRAMVASMRPGSVIVDLAAEGGGNCELTQPGREVLTGGVLVCGPTDLASRMATDASQLYSQNIARFAVHLVRDGTVQIDLADEITGATCVIHEGITRGVLVAEPQAAVA